MVNYSPIGTEKVRSGRQGVWPVPKDIESNQFLDFDRIQDSLRKKSSGLLD